MSSVTSWGLSCCTQWLHPSSTCTRLSPTSCSRPLRRVVPSAASLPPHSTRVGVVMGRLMASQMLGMGLWLMQSPKALEVREGYMIR
jgi:hypothetical protein